MARIVGGCSLHAEYDPSKCPKVTPGLKDQRCGLARCVDCCKETPDMDVIECSRCGQQRTVACTFDDDYS